MRNIVNRLLKSDNVITRSTAMNFLYVFCKLIREYRGLASSKKVISEIRKYKTSDTIVILGAGSSVNELSDDQLRFFEDVDVVGFGYTCILPVKQRVMFYESPHWTELSLIEEHRVNLVPEVKNAVDEGKITKVVWKNSENRHLKETLGLEAFGTVKFLNLLCHRPTTFHNILKIFLFLRFYRLFLIQCRGSVVGLCVFALSMGYKRVIFCGVDLNENPYFWINNPNYETCTFGDPYLVLDGKASKIHRTNDPIHGVPVSIFLKKIVECYPNVEFCVSSQNSSLSEFMGSM